MLQNAAPTLSLSINNYRNYLYLQQLLKSSVLLKPSLSIHVDDERVSLFFKILITWRN